MTEHQTSTDGVYLTPFFCRVGMEGEPAVGIKLREGFQSIVARLTDRRARPVLTSLVESLGGVVVWGPRAGTNSEGGE